MMNGFLHRMIGVAAAFVVIVVAVLDALPLMKFRPAEIKGVKVRQLVQQPFVFHVKK